MQETIKPHVVPQFAGEDNKNQSDDIEFDKPYKPGDYICISLPQMILMGRVLAIGLGYTKLRSNWGSTIIIPDFVVANATIANFSVEEKYQLAPAECAEERGKVAEVL